MLQRLSALTILLGHLQNEMLIQELVGQVCVTSHTQNCWLWFNLISCLHRLTCCYLFFNEKRGNQQLSQKVFVLLWQSIRWSACNIFVFRGHVSVWISFSTMYSNYSLCGKMVTLMQTDRNSRFTFFISVLILDSKHLEFNLCKLNEIPVYKMWKTSL